MHQRRCVANAVDVFAVDFEVVDGFVFEAWDDQGNGGEWLTERQRRCEGLCLNDNNDVIGQSKLNPLPGDLAVNKSLSTKPKPPPSGVPVFKPWEAEHFQPFRPAQPAKTVMEKPKAS